MINILMKHQKWLYTHQILKRTEACGIAGLSIVADSLAAIKYGKVRVIRDEDGDAVDYVVEQPYVPFGNK